MVRLLVLVLTLLCQSNLLGQEGYLLSSPRVKTTSVAEVDSRQIRVTTSGGATTVYRRDSRFDSADRVWTGYYNRELLRALRWPRSNRGALQIGEVQGTRIVYRESEMTITPRQRDDRVVRPDRGGIDLPRGTATSAFEEIVVGNSVDPSWVRLASQDNQGARWLLSNSGASSRLDRIRYDNATADADLANWYVAPVGQGMVRLQAYQQGQLLAVGASSRQRLLLSALSQDSSQLWRVSPGNQSAGGYLLESVRYPGQCLSLLGGGVGLQPIGFSPTQLWAPIRPPAAASLSPFMRSIRQEVQAAPPLPPADVELVNAHRNALIVLLADRRGAGSIDRIRIEPGETTVVRLDRDAGATVVESHETVTRRGAWRRQEFSTVVPPVSFYDISVYEEHLQSIAIDSTGKSANPIEDVNYAPKSIGWLLVPPGAELAAQERIDLFASARAARNPGAVRRIDPRELEAPSKSSPVEDILERFRKTKKEDF